MVHGVPSPSNGPAPGEEAFNGSFNVCPRFNSWRLASGWGGSGARGGQGSAGGAGSPGQHASRGAPDAVNSASPAEPGHARPPAAKHSLRAAALVAGSWEGQGPAGAPSAGTVQRSLALHPRDRRRRRRPRVPPGPPPPNVRPFDVPRRTLRGAGRPGRGGLLLGAPRAPAHSLSSRTPSPSPSWPPSRARPAA